MIDYQRKLPFLSLCLEIRILELKKYRMMNITLKQAELAKTLFQIDDSQLLDEIARSIEHAFLKYKHLPNPAQTRNEADTLLELAKQPTPKHIPLEVLAKEQNFTNDGFSEALNSVDDSLFEGDDLEELLTTLTK